MVCTPPCFLRRLQCFSKRTFLGTPAIELVPECFFPFSPLLEDISEDSNLPFLLVQTRSIASNKVRSEHMSIGVMPFLFMLYWSCHWIGHICSTWLPSSASVQNVLRLGAGICVGAVVEAWHLGNVGIELLYRTYKLTYVDMLGLLNSLSAKSILAEEKLVARYSIST